MNDKLKSQMERAEPPKYMFREQDDGSLEPSRVVPGNSISQLRPRAYEARFIPATPMSPGRSPWFEPIEMAPPPDRIYGDVTADVDRYMRTFQRMKGNMGVAQIGTKGSGKTTTIRSLARTAVMMDMPVIFVNEPLPREALEFLVRSVAQDSVWVFEEFDKNFSTNEGGTIDTSYQNHLLSIFDGSVVGGKKLYVLAANDVNKISPFLLHRPERIRYTKYYERLPHATMVGYVKDNIKTGRALDVVHFVKLRGIYPFLNFDMMSALVDELNHNLKLSLMEAVHVMFGDAGRAHSISYIATVTMPDGQTHKVYASENVHRKGSRINIGMSALNDTEEDIFQDFKLLEEHFVSHSDDLKELTYELDGKKIVLRLTQDEIGESGAISLNTVDDPDYDDDQELRRSLQTRADKRRLAVEAKVERDRKEREAKAKAEREKKGEPADKAGNFLVGVEEWARQPWTR